MQTPNGKVAVDLLRVTDTKMIVWNSREREHH